MAKVRGVIFGLLMAICVGVPAAVVAAPGGYTMHVVDLAKDAISLNWQDAGGRRIGSIGRLATEMKAQGRILAFATNAGIFEKNYTPLGLYIENGRTLRALNKGAGAGNFYLTPNAVFYVDDKGGHVVRTEAFKAGPAIAMATQSGPMLVEHNIINSRFSAASKNRLVRSGVGINADGKIVFAISSGAVTFYEFATEFRDQLHCTDAMFLDGVISRMYAPDNGRKDVDGDFVGMIAVTTAAKGH